MQVGEPLNGIGKSALVDLRVFCPEAVADGPVADSGKFKRYIVTPGFLLISRILLYLGINLHRILLNSWRELFDPKWIIQNEPKGIKPKFSDFG
jgi:hypothetical protein